MSTTWSKLADLSFRIDAAVKRGLSLRVSPSFTRLTTELRLMGEGLAGTGEDVVYETADQLAFQAAPVPDLAGVHTLASFSKKLDELDLFPADSPVREESRDYRRWTFESAALDLALRQNRTSLAAALGREPAPLTFVVSLGLGNPPSLAPLRARLAHHPDLRFKVDAGPDWNDALCDELAATGRVVTVDLKGYYSGTPVDLEPDVDLYLRIAERVPGAWIEDARLTPEVWSVLEPHLDRLTFDAPIHRVDDVEALPFRPRCLNLKPSRSGRLEDLFALHDYCATRGIATYAGGQFELGTGRGQIQALASLFHADGWNDCAPAVFHGPIDAAWPRSPLAPTPLAQGFGWRD